MIDPESISFEACIGFTLIIFIACFFTAWLINSKMHCYERLSTFKGIQNIVQNLWVRVSRTGYLHDWVYHFCNV
jgi:hypothetical protein